MLGAYFFEAHFQVVLRLLLIVRKRLVDKKLLFDVDLNKKKKKKNCLRLRAVSKSCFWTFRDGTHKEVRSTVVVSQ